MPTRTGGVLIVNVNPLSPGDYIYGPPGSSDMLDVSETDARGC